MLINWLVRRRRRNKLGGFLAGERSPMQHYRPCIKKFSSSWTERHTSTKFFGLWKSSKQNFSFLKFRTHRSPSVKRVGDICHSSGAKYGNFCCRVRKSGQLKLSSKWPLRAVSSVTRESKVAKCRCLAPSSPVPPTARSHDTT